MNRATQRREKTPQTVPVPPHPDNEVIASAEYQLPGQLEEIHSKFGG